MNVPTCDGSGAVAAGPVGAGSGTYATGTGGCTPTGRITMPGCGAGAKRKLWAPETDIIVVHSSGCWRPSLYEPYPPSETPPIARYSRPLPAGRFFSTKGANSPRMKLSKRGGGVL